MSHVASLGSGDNAELRTPHSLVVFEPPAQLPLRLRAFDLPSVFLCSPDENN